MASTSETVDSLGHRPSPLHLKPAVFGVMCPETIKTEKEFGLRRRALTDRGGEPLGTPQSRMAIVVEEGDSSLKPGGPPGRARRPASSRWRRRRGRSSTFGLGRTGGGPPPTASDTSGSRGSSGPGLSSILSGMLTLPWLFGWTGFRRLRAYGDWALKLHHEHAPGRHAYLWAIGARPQDHGKGIAGQLVAPILAR